MCRCYMQLRGVGMATGKERLRRWRERNRAAGKQSFTVMLSREAKDILLQEQAVSGGSYSAIMEQALLSFSKTAALATGAPTQKKPKLLIDEDGELRGEIEPGGGNQGNGITENHAQLGSGFMPRLLKRSNNRIYKLRK